MSVGQPGIPTPLPDYNAMLSTMNPAPPQTPPVAPPPAAPQVPNTPHQGSAPFGGANLPPSGSTPSGGGAPTTPAVENRLVQKYIQAGQIQPGRFQNDEQLMNALITLAQQQAEALEAVQGQQPAAPQPPAAPPTTPTPPATPGVDLSQLATVFQQQGLLSFQNGQWIATNPVAQEAAVQLNRKALEAQAIQAELSDPRNFILKHGADALKEKLLTPVEQRLAEMAAQIERQQQLLDQAIPKPHEAWFNENRKALETVDATGQPVKTAAGVAFENAWNTAVQAGVNDPVALHKIAQAAALPVIQQVAPPQQPQAPAVPWFQQAQNTPATDTGFGLPGSQVGNPHQPTGIGVPVTNDGFPDYHQMLRQGIQ